jgi:hypothetical protein
MQEKSQLYTKEQEEELKLMAAQSLDMQLFSTVLVQALNDSFDPYGKSEMIAPEDLLSGTFNNFNVIPNSQLHRNAIDKFEEVIGETYDLVKDSLQRESSGSQSKEMIRDKGVKASTDAQESFLSCELYDKLREENSPIFQKLHGLTQSLEEHKKQTEILYEFLKGARESSESFNEYIKAHPLDATVQIPQVDLMRLVKAAKELPAMPKDFNGLVDSINERETEKWKLKRIFKSITPLPQILADLDSPKSPKQSFVEKIATAKISPTPIAR